jgi:hypothetical protein
MPRKLGRELNSAKGSPDGIRIPRTVLALMDVWASQSREPSGENAKSVPLR